ncbi:MAG: SLBB domain-containing protein [bacterium]|nr:SLBB domain-containing protein [bacterium]
MKHLTPNDIVNLVFQAGIVGAGGGGFPTHVKLKATVDTILANGSECEPLLASDKTLMKNNAFDIVQGMKLAMQATSAKQGIIAVKGHYTDVVAALEEAVKNETSIKIHKLENYYPAGDEFLTVYDATGRIIPEGGLPLHVGVVVSNVLSLAQITQAVSGKPVTERIVTIAGEVNKPCVVSVPIGTPYKDLINLAEGKSDPDAQVIDGGPMMGNVVKDLNAGIAKTTSGLVVLSKNSLVVRMKEISLGQMIKLSKSACCQCFRCTDLCPRNLLGHELYPHATMRTLDYNSAEATKHITSAFLCSQCGVCELIACDFMLLSPKRIYAAYRKELVAKGIKNPHSKKPEQVTSAYEDRKVSVAMVMKKLGIEKYYKKNIPFLGNMNTNFVSIPINKHIGAPSLPAVNVGQSVSMGDMIATCPEKALGANYHASISGEVVEVTESYINLRKKP